MSPALGSALQHQGKLSPQGPARRAQACLGELAGETAAKKLPGVGLRPSGAAGGWARSPAKPLRPVGNLGYRLEETEAWPMHWAHGIPGNAGALRREAAAVPFRHRVPPPSPSPLAIGGGKGAAHSPGNRGGPLGKSGRAGPHCPSVASRAWVSRGAPRPGCQGQPGCPVARLLGRAHPLEGHPLTSSLQPAMSQHFKPDKAPPSAWSVSCRVSLGFGLISPERRLPLPRRHALGTAGSSGGNPRTNPDPVQNGSF